MYVENKNPCGFLIEKDVHPTYLIKAACQTLCKMLSLQL